MGTFDIDSTEERQPVIYNIPTKSSHNARSAALQRAMRSGKINEATHLEALRKAFREEYAPPGGSSRERARRLRQIERDKK